jgi:hypothetical protein
VTRRFTPGDVIAWRSVDPAEGTVGYAWPWVVVRDEPAVIVLFLSPGATAKIRTGEYGGPRDRLLLRWDGGYRDNVWTGVNLLMLHRPGDAHSVWLARDATTWEPMWWYVNLEDRWRRSPLGFDSRDRLLDLWAKPDRRAWEWKDEDEVAWSVANGRLSAGAAAEVRAEGERALERVRRWEPPLDDAWIGWRPDPRWPVPSLPEGWDRYDPAEARPL